MHFNDQIKKCAKLTAKLPKSAYKAKFINLKLNKDPLPCRVYFLSFMNFLKIVF